MQPTPGAIVGPLDAQFGAERAQPERVPDVADDRSRGDVRVQGADPLRRDDRLRKALIVLAEVGYHELVARIASWLSQLLTDVGQRVDANDLGLEALDLYLLHQFRLRNQIRCAYIEGSRNLLHHYV